MGDERRYGQTLWRSGRFRCSLKLGKHWRGMLFKGLGRSLGCGIRCALDLSPSANGAEVFCLLEQRERRCIQVFPQKFEECLLVLIPCEAIFRMCDSEALEFQLAEQTLVAIAVGSAKNLLGAVALVGASLN